MPQPPMPFGFALPEQFRGQTLSTYQPTFREMATDYLRRMMFSDDREGQRKAERVSNVLETVTPFGFATGIDDAKEALGQGDYLTAGMMGAMAMAPGPSPKIKAYHGSPHSFDRFDMSKIGTGEGAQAYGHGLYFAENEKVAQDYKKNVKDMGAIAKINNRLSELAKIMDADSAGGYRKFKSDTGRQAAEEYDALMAQRTGVSEAPGSMYEVNINASPEDFLDWDKPLSEQPGIKQKLLSPGGLIGDIENNQYAADFLEPFVNGEYDSLTGRELVGMLERLGQNEYLPVNGPNVSQYLDSGHTPPAVSNVLRNEGIPGIKYLDAGSRGKGDGSRNYVVFDDKLIEIVRKYGIAGASAMLGYNLLEGVDAAQAKQLQDIEKQR